MEKNRLWNLINILLDDVDMNFSENWTICKLYDNGFTFEEIRTIGYDYTDKELEKIVSGEEN